MARTFLKVLAVVFYNLILIDIDVIKTAHIDRAHFSAAWFVASSERADPAVRAEIMMNDFFVEEIFLQRVLATQKFEIFFGYEAQQMSFLVTNRTIA